MVKGGNILPSFGGCSKRKQTMDRTYGIYGTYVASAKWRRTPNAERQTPNAKRQTPPAFLGWLLLLPIVDNFAPKNAPLAWQI
jgi:hypothetical protein